MDAPLCRPYARRVWLALPLILWTAACARSPQQTVLTADMPLHLEDHLEASLENALYGNPRANSSADRTSAILRDESVAITDPMRARDTVWT